MRNRLLLGLAVLAGALAGCVAPAGAQPGGYHQGLADETPAVIAKTPDAWDHLRVANEDAAARQTAAAAQTAQRGCTTRILPPTSWSSRAGATPALGVLHYTVSSNRPGWGDVDAIWGWFAQPRAQASSNYIVDFEGHCLLAVAEHAKAWTQGAFNPHAISIEFVATGRETTLEWAAAPGLRVGARIIADAFKRWGIPIRWAKTDGCAIVRSGLTDHDALACGNTHTDVAPAFPYARFLELVRQEAGLARAQVILRGPSGKIAARCAPSPARPAAEADRLRRCLANKRALIALRLQRRGRIELVRTRVP